MLEFIGIWLENGESGVLQTIHNSADHNKNLYCKTKFGGQQMTFLAYTVYLCVKTALFLTAVNTSALCLKTV